MTNIYNKIYHAPNGTLIGNWYEEECLREKTGEGRTVPYSHVPKKSLDFDKEPEPSNAPRDNTFDRLMGEMNYKEFKTTNSTYGDFSQPENKYKVLSMQEKMYNDFFKCYVGKDKPQEQKEPAKAN